MLVPIFFLAAVYAAIIILDLRYGLLSIDRLDTSGAKFAAYLWLGLFFAFVANQVAAASHRQPSAENLAKMPFWNLFLMHAILVLFLALWWLIAKRPPLLDYLNIQRKNIGEAIMTGFAVGVGGWILTIVFAILISAILTAAGLVPKHIAVPPAIHYMAHLAWWKKLALVLSAGIFEEAFFRGWLQKRIGLIASTILFAFAHLGYGQPLLLIGVTVVSLIIGTTFYRTKNLIPGMIAHSIFDAIQLFVLVPLAIRFAT